ncbi:MAG: NAD(P)/FAD-dependent oxidoreductase [Candidatus Poseidoniales archaeon]|nr:NAD(P)/FAD-dependent oxidoreductase [Candidatus Poseidoniales archaeon]RJV01318.1 MAG: NAD(P)/FAD-dependent oxidoreductase [Candidatus Poseidoniales archaeon]
MASGCFWDEPIETGPIPATDSNFDCIVVGGGPGGAAAASYLAMEGKKVLLIEKGVWPRDKVCGDAVGGKSLGHVSALGVKAKLESTTHFRVTGIVFSSPNGSEVTVPLPEEDVEKMEAGYSLPRQQFDWLLFERATELVVENGGHVIQGATVTEVHDVDGKITGVEIGIGGKRGEKRTYTAPWTIGAGGYQCPVARKVVKDLAGEELVDRMHYCGGYREYWSGVKGCEGNAGNIEIHFVDGVIPGYFWLFPLGEGRVNVGIGMVLGLMDKQKKKLKSLQASVIANHPSFKERFADAEMIEGTGKGWQLPFGSPRKGEKNQPRRAYSPGALLVGDAASLVDPFSGEGVGNALVSGEMAARHVIENKGGQEYQTELWEALGPELTNSFKMQKMSRRKWLLNWFVGKASRKPVIQEMMTEMIASKEAQENLHSKWFLVKTLLF